MLLLLASGNICPWVICLLHKIMTKQQQQQKSSTLFYNIYICMYIFFCKESRRWKKKPLKVESPVFHVQRCQLVWQRWESWEPSGGLELRLRAEIWNGRDLILHVMRPNRAGRELRLRAPSDKESGSQLPACHASPSSSAAFLFCSSQEA